MRVNGHSVSQEEFCWFRQQQRAAVLSGIKTTYDVEPGKNIWYQDHNGITPKDIINEKTTQKVAREKVEQGLFQELGLVEDIRFATFLADLEKLNEEHECAVEQRKVIYGPIQYTQLQYYGHWMTTMQTRAKDKLRKEQLNITEAKIREYYTLNRNLFKTAESLTLDTLVLRSKETSESKNKLESLADEIVLKAQRGLTLESAAHEYADNKDFTIQFRKYEQIQDDRLGELFPDSTHFKEIRALSPSGAIRFAASGNEVWIVQCISVMASHDLPYEQIRSILVDRYVDSEYNRLIDTRIQKARVEINRDVLDKIDIQ